VLEIFFWMVLLLLLYPLVFYPVSLLILDRFYNDETYSVDNCFSPLVSLIITAYNEEKVIVNKLNNVLELNYPKDQLEIIIASDGSSDKTSELVGRYIDEHKDYNIKLFDIQGRRGKTHAQNIAARLSSGEIIAFSDSNSIWDVQALKFLINRFKDEKLGYLSGKLQYVNSDANITSKSENIYWNLDLKLRLIESKVSSTVGGNGAIYAIRKENYVDLPDLLSHDGFMPTKMVLQGMKAKFEPRAVAYEKSGETSNDEYKRKVRMQRGQPWKKYYDIEKFNIFKYGWFSYFYIGHKYLKYQLYILHFALYFLNVILSLESNIYLFILVFHSIFYLLSVIGWVSKSKSKVFYFPYYYSMTIIAQAHAVIITLSGKSKPTWIKADSTR
jgi:cellulose synthase/poly-beta-1,6-N-acetylglucosamine synthase-like glycosyltransferase